MQNTKQKTFLRRSSVCVRGHKNDPRSPIAFISLSSRFRFSLCVSLGRLEREGVPIGAPGTAKVPVGTARSFLQRHEAEVMRGAPNHSALPTLGRTSNGLVCVPRLHLERNE